MLGAREERQDVLGERESAEGKCNCVLLRILETKALPACSAVIAGTVRAKAGKKWGTDHRSL